MSFSSRCLLLLIFVALLGAMGIQASASKSALASTTYRVRVADVGTFKVLEYNTVQSPVYIKLEYLGPAGAQTPTVTTTPTTPASSPTPTSTGTPVISSTPTRTPTPTAPGMVPTALPTTTPTPPQLNYKCFLPLVTE